MNAVCLHLLLARAAALCPVVDGAAVLTTSSLESFPPNLQNLMTTNKQQSTYMLDHTCTLVPQNELLIFRFQGQRYVRGVTVTLAQNYGANGLVVSLLSENAVSMSCVAALL